MILFPNNSTKHFCNVLNNSNCLPNILKKTQTIFDEYFFGKLLENYDTLKCSKHFLGTFYGILLNNFEFFSNIF